MEIGAEDYIVKPFEAVELIARIHVILRRNQKAAHEFKLDDTIADLDKHIVRKLLSRHGASIFMEKQEPLTCTFRS